MQLIKKRTSKNKSLYIDLVSEIFIVCLITYILNYVCNHYSTTTSWYILAILFTDHIWYNNIFLYGYDLIKNFKKKYKIKSK